VTEEQSALRMVSLSLPPPSLARAFTVLAKRAIRTDCTPSTASDKGSRFSRSLTMAAAGTPRSLSLNTAGSPEEFLMQTGEVFPEESVASGQSFQWGGT
jgi:hypothetical protein